MQYQNYALRNFFSLRPTPPIRPRWAQERRVSALRGRTPDKKAPHDLYGRAVFSLAGNTAEPYRHGVQTVVETNEYLAAAKKAGMSDAERSAAVDLIAADPEAGDIMQGTGGCRKVRVPKEGSGKRGGYRIVSYYTDANTPVFLLTVISKGKQANLTDRQKADLKKGKPK